MSAADVTDDTDDTDDRGTLDSVEPIAVVGLAVRVPGASDLDQFWQNLVDGRESVTFFGREEQLAKGATPAEMDDPSWVPAAPVVDKVEHFDAGLFGMTPREATLADPQHRLFLETAHSALEDAGYDPARYDGAIGVYAGSGNAWYEWMNLRANSSLWSGAAGHLGVSTVNSPDYVATLVSYKLNLSGPSLTVHTACSTSMIALHLACEALRNGECDMALAGGVCIELPHGKGYFGIEGYTSPDGHCRPFDAAAAGTLWGSGAGVVLLARLEDALAAGDHIRAVIRGNAINNDGADKVGFSAPSINGQAAAIAQAVSVAGIDPRTIGYVEAHGTGTALGDPIEVAALSQVYGEDTEERQWCGIGSVKANIGHLSQAAGIVGVAKAVLALENGVIPPAVNYEHPNPAIDFPSTPFHVVVSPSKFEPARPGVPRRAAVSSFGIGGTNGHVVLEEAPPSRATEAAPSSIELLQLSAASEPALRAAVDRLAGHLEGPQALDLTDVAHTLRVGRTERRHRAVLAARDLHDAVAGLRDPKRLQVARSFDPAPPVAFLFSGQGAQYAGMARELYDAVPRFAETLDRLLPLVPELREVVFDPARGDELGQTRWTQPALFVIEHALADLWQGWGIRPSGLIGHSIGEYVAATLAGVFAPEDALRLVATRGRLMQGLPAGSMLAVGLDEADVAPRLPDGLVVATVNGPGTCVVAGPTPLVEGFAGTLRADDVSARPVRTSHAFHSPMMDPILAEFEAAVAAVPRSAPEQAFWSNLTGTPITPDQATDPAYWARHLRQPVRFGACLAGLLADGRPWHLVECGPGRQLTGLVRLQVARGGSARNGLDEAPVAMPSLPGAQDRDGDLATLLGAAGRLWAAGCPVAPESPSGRRGRRIPLPTYAYQRSRYWSEPDPPGEISAPVDRGPRELPDWFAVPVWRQLPALTSHEDLEACAVFSAGPRGDALVEALRVRGVDVSVVRPSDSYDAEHDRVVHAFALDGEAVAERAQELGFFHALGLVQSYADRPARIDIVTAGTEDAVPGALTRPAYATLAGIARVAPLDLPDLTVRRIDVDDRTPADRLVDELLAPTTEEVALAGGRRWVRAFESVRLPEPVSDVPIRNGGTYLVTGGTGGIGITVAEDLARRAQAHVVLLARTGLPPRDTWDDHLARHGSVDRTGRAIAAIRRIEAYGGSAEVIAADVADADDLRGVRKALEGRGLAGIVHAAGVPGGGLTELKDRDEAARVLRPKVAGTLALHEVFGDVDLDFVLLCSSVTGVAGGVGQIDYCAANAFLDAFARSTHAWSARVVSVDWAGWTEVGMAAEVEAPDALKVVRSDGSEPLDHPILTARAGTSAYGTIGPETHWVLDEHRIEGVPVLPGTAHLESVRAAAALDGPVELTDVAFLEPFAVRARARYEVEIDDREFRVLGDGRVHVSGCVGRSEGAEPAELLCRLDIPAIVARCRPAPTSEWRTQEGRTSVVAFGPRWDALREVHRGDGEELALIEAPDAVAVDLDRWGLHPALLDVATSFGFDDAEGAYLPLGYGRVLIRDRLPAKFYSHLRYHDGDGDGGVAAADITLAAPDGTVLVEITEFTLRRLESGAAVVPASEPEVARAGGRAAAEKAGIAPEDGVEALYRLLARDLGPQVVVGPVPIDAVLDRIRRESVDTIAEAAVTSPVAAQATGSGQDFAAPRTDTEATVARVWQDVLGLERVGADDDFFALGGNSLIAVQLIAEIRKAVRVKLPMRSLFEAPTVAALAERIDALRTEPSNSDPQDQTIPKLRRE